MAHPHVAGQDIVLSGAVNDPASGQAAHAITAAKTDALRSSAPLFDVQLKDAKGVTKTLVDARMIIVDDVTRRETVP